ncbi:ATP-binding cassette domain-containing protein [Bacillus cereus]|uniref:ABC transporter ATP-binding protein n=1 Tax=Bacillus cereus TaxID=1396 RepID=UPI002DB7A448|nr:ABC transporter ATP-binding protein [Bacillus cereus]
MKAIEVKELSKVFNDQVAINNISFSVDEREIFGFLGRNGAGKSTFINIITGIKQKTSGTFEIFGHNDSRIDKIKEYIGVMPDVSNLYHNMKAIDFLIYMSQLKGFSITKKEALDLLEKVGLKGHEHKKIGSYSFGMKKKISLSQAIVGKPKLVFLDEPTSGLDPESAFEIQNLIRDLNNEGMTIFLTSHNLQEIERMCDRIAIMNKGTIEKIGTLDELRAQIKQHVEIKIKYKLETNSNFDIKERVKGINKVIEINDEYIILKIDSEKYIPQIIKQFIANQIEIFSVTQNQIDLEEIFFDEN